MHERIKGTHGPVSLGKPASLCAPRSALSQHTGTWLSENLESLPQNIFPVFTSLVYPPSSFAWTTTTATGGPFHVLKLPSSPVCTLRQRNLLKTQL